MKTWFTSDHHFGHKNIIEYEQRPFANVESMNRILIENWNKTVAPGDVVYHLGDFALDRLDAIKTILDQLTGDVHLILGNHYRNAK